MLYLRVKSGTMGLGKPLTVIQICIVCNTHTHSLCLCVLLFIFIDVIKHLDQNQLKGGRVSLVYNSRLWSIMWQVPEVEPWTAAHRGGSLGWPLTVSIVRAARSKT